MSINKKFNGTVYVGRSTMRTEDEPSYMDLEDGLDELKERFPQAYPHIFVSYEGVTLAEALMKPSRSVKGAGGLLAGQYQPLVRNEGSNGASTAQVNKWRENFDVERLLGLGEVIDLTDDEPTRKKARDCVPEGGPYVVLDASDVDLNVPMQPEDMLRKIREVEDKLGKSLIGDDPSDAEVRNMYETVQSIINK